MGGQSLISTCLPRPAMTGCTTQSHSKSFIDMDSDESYMGPVVPSTCFQREIIFSRSNAEGSAYKFRAGILTTQLLEHWGIEIAFHVLPRFCTTSCPVRQEPQCVHFAAADPTPTGLVSPRVLASSALGCWTEVCLWTCLGCGLEPSWR